MIRRVVRVLEWVLGATLVFLGLRWLAIYMRRVPLAPTADVTPPIDVDEITVGQRKIIVSDLHMGSGGRNDDFEANAAFTEFMHAYVMPIAPIELILAGDTFEFLQVRLPEINDYEWSGYAAQQRLAAILAVHAAPIAALREFIVQPGNQLTLLIGNHDFELHYVAAKNLLRQALGVSEHDARVRFGVSYEGDGMYLIHGNQLDEWNRFIRFESISQPFEVVRGTRVMKDIINVLEDDPLNVAPLVDNVKPTSAFLWYLLALPRLRQPEVRRYVVRALLLLFRSEALPRAYRTQPVLAVREDLLGPPNERGPRAMALQATYALEPALRQAAAAAHGGVEPRLRLRERTVGALAFMQRLVKRLRHDEGGRAATQAQMEHDARRQLQREIRAFKGAVTRAMAEIAHSSKHTHNTVFVCGHTHLAQVVALNERQTYFNTGTWTMIVRDVANDIREQRRFPFLDVQYASDGTPQAQLLVWRGVGLAPSLWDVKDEVEDSSADVGVRAFESAR